MQNKTISLEQFNELDVKSAKIRDNPKNNYLRTGQILFNVLYDIAPEVANEIRGTEFDPYYLDSRIRAFLDRIYPDDVKVP